ncbi:hypothetical protein bcgnr5371_35380 [Bacillus cereus]
MLSIYMVISIPSEPTPLYVLPIICLLVLYASLTLSTIFCELHSLGKNVENPPFAVLGVPFTSILAL